MIRSLKLSSILFVLVLVFAATYRGAMLNHPFERNAEGCGAFFGLLARNYFRYDFSQHHGIPVMSMGAGAAPLFYANHPPTTPLLIALVQAVSGSDSEWTTRLPTAIFTLASAVAIFVMVRNRANPQAALLASAIFLWIPMTIMFGGFPDVIAPQLLLFVMLTVAAYERFHDAPGARNFVILCIMFLCSTAMDWPAFHLVPVLAVHFAFTRPLRQWPWMIGLGLLSCAAFVLIYAYLTTAQDSWQWMLGQLKRRSFNNVGDQFHAYSWMGWLKRAWQFGVARHTVIVVAIALLWLPLACARRFSHGCDRLTGLLLAWAAVHIVIGRQGVYQHEWWWWPLTPGLVIAAALVIDACAERLQKCLPQRVVQVGLIICVICFAAWNFRAIREELASVNRPGANPINYSLIELGQVIRESTPPHSAVMIAESDQSLATWYYADRAMKRSIWDVNNFRRRLDDKMVEASFDHPQPWSGPVAAMIVPKAYLPMLVPGLIEYLDAHYPRRDTDKFIIYDIRAEGKMQSAEKGTQ